MMRKTPAALPSLLALLPALSLGGLAGCTPEEPPPGVGETFDCATVPDEPLAETVVDGANGYKGLAFDGEGNIVGTDGSNLFKTSRDGDSTVFLRWAPTA
jgi:hypothetical protein